MQVVADLKRQSPVDLEFMSTFSDRLWMNTASTVESVTLFSEKSKKLNLFVDGPNTVWCNYCEAMVGLGT